MPKKNPAGTDPPESVVQTTIVKKYVTGTLNAFFEPAYVTVAAPAPAQEAPAQEAPGRWLPAPLPRESRVSQTLGGALRIQCNPCRIRKRPMPFHGADQFVPEKNPRDAAAYGAALEALGEARAAKDGAAFFAARETIAALATAWCASCRESNAKTQANPTTTTGACRAEWKRLKVEVFHTCDRCGATRAIEADHGDECAANAKAHKAMVASDGEEAADAAYPAEERKLAQLSTYTYWSCNGGVEAMRAEADKCDPLCSMCHALDPSSSTAPENAASRAKAGAKEYETERKRQLAVHKAGYKEDKRVYVNAIKRAIGACERPDCPCDGPSDKMCVLGFEACYDLDHIDPTTKGRAIAAIVNDSRSLATAKPDILKELGLPPDFDVDTDDVPPVAARRCRMLCRNCHHTRDEWDA